MKLDKERLHIISLGLCLVCYPVIVKAILLNSDNPMMEINPFTLIGFLGSSLWFASEITWLFKLSKRDKK